MKVCHSRATRIPIKFVQFMGFNRAVTASVKSRIGAAKAYLLFEVLSVVTADMTGRRRSSCIRMK